MNILYLIEVIVGFGFIIAIHEAGHFLAAKRAGITCPVFSVGFPLPRIPGLPNRWRNIVAFTRNGTEYRIGWIPFGGFVQMKGQSDTPGQLDAAEQNAKDDFRNVSYGNKALVLAGGVIMNAITGVLFFIAAFMVFGVTFTDPVAGAIVTTDERTSEPTDLWRANIVQPGDRILTVNGERVVDFQDIFYESLAAESVVHMEMQRPDESKYNATVPLIRHKALDLKMPPIGPPLAVTIGDKEAARSGGTLEPGDRLESVEGVPVATPEAALHLLSKVKPGEKVSVSVRRKGEDAPIVASYEPKRLPFDPKMHYLGGLAFASPVIIRAVQDLSPASRAGLKDWDEIVAVRVAGKQGEWIDIASPDQVHRYLQLSGAGGMELRIRRGKADETHDISVAPEPNKLQGGRSTIGVLFAAGRREAHAARAKALGEPAPAQDAVFPLVVADVLPGSAADMAGIHAGMTLLDVPGMPTEEKSGGFLGFGSKMKTFKLEERLVKAFEPGIEGKAVTVELQLQEPGGASPRNFKLELDPNGPDSTAVMELEAREVRSAPVTYGFVGSIGAGFYHTRKMMTQIFQTLGGLFTGEVSISHLGGPVLIAKRSYDLAEWGLGTLLFFLGFISINLAVVNLLPIPILDGGLLLVATVEKLKGSPLNEKVMALVNLTAFLAVIGLMLFIVFNDVMRLWVL